MKEYTVLAPFKFGNTYYRPDDETCNTISLWPKDAVRYLNLRMIVERETNEV